MRACFAAFLKPFRFTAVGLWAIAAGCSGDVDDLFENGGAAPSSATTEQSSADAGNTATNTATNTVSQTTDAAQSSTDAGEATASTQEATTASDAASTAEQASSSTGQPTTTLACGQLQCDLSANEVCCLFDPIDTTECKTQCNGVEVALECDRPDVCNGGVCCAEAVQFGQGYERVVCTGNACDSGEDRVVCATVNDCGPDQICDQSSFLPSGYKVCKDAN